MMRLKNLDKNRLIKFMIVGFSGVIVNYFIYFPFKDIFIFDLVFSSIVFHMDLMWFFGIVISASSNYILNEVWTFYKQGDSLNSN